MVLKGQKGIEGIRVLLGGVGGLLWGCWGIRGVGGVRGVLGVAHTHWAPVQGSTTPTGSPGEVTYLAKANQVTEMSSAGYYIHLEL